MYGLGRSFELLLLVEWLLKICWIVEIPVMFDTGNPERLIWFPRRPRPSTRSQGLHFKDVAGVQMYKAKQTVAAATY